ncbi:efflux transporter outer membrane subunit [Methylosinus sp. LW4]|uniref:efflux transporter outer membrane subunit n=1 Tax=Methylosinus sp. LW4 TaxID=136993 RepID=UPI0003803BCB|nr:efflux transporter outer membrane subunit [Methylosinus sp. LW4]
MFNGLSARFCATLVLAASLVRCSVGPDFVPPDPKLPQKSYLGSSEIAGPSAERASGLHPAWWRQFKDATLAALVERVSGANLDVRIATERLWQSRAQRDAAAAAQLPLVNASGQYTRELLSNNGIVSLGSAFNNGVPLKIPPINIWQTGFDASWEIDLWGHVRRQVEAAEAQAESLEYQRRDMLVSTVAELVRDYVELRGVEAQIAITKSNLASAKEIAHWTKQRADRGAATYLDVENAAAQVESAQAQLPALANQESAYIDAIGLLLDEPPQALRATLARRGPQLLSPPRPPVGLPSELARRRPDIRRAEAELHAATANIGVTIAEFYPSFKFNGAVDFNALDAKKLFHGASLQYQFGPTVSVPIFDAGRLKSQLELRDAQSREAALVYHKTVLTAWTEVVDALVALRTEQTRFLRLNAQAAHQREALALARARYNSGVSDFINVLDAQRQALQAELLEAQSRTIVATNFVKLYKALGGGWEGDFPVVDQTEPQSVAHFAPPFVAGTTTARP